MVDWPSSEPFFTTSSQHSTQADTHRHARTRSHTHARTEFHRTQKPEGKLKTISRLHSSAKRVHQISRRQAVAAARGSNSKTIQPDVGQACRQPLSAAGGAY